ncbi:TLP1 [Symbiodinium pilosum]|uniref:TLP1 protein n=1 Tax=Symbiodinium pilosum TaxID=2952 RepID=A0A812XK78_SYMPI|nr:TLP1 [Symbiodinium pilosum]
MKRLLLASCLSTASAGIPRLEIINGCPHETMWIAHLANVGIGPGPINHAIPPLGNMIFDETETDQLAGARYWPKMGCNKDGNNCLLGGSGGPGQHCNELKSDYSLCQPPIDTKFEATWGKKGQPCNPADPGQMAGCDFIDMSLVDGFTLPFKLEIVSGQCTGQAPQPVTSLDCSGLSVDKCPVDDDIGKGPTNMQAINPKINKPIGCYAPCLKLIDTKWNNVQANGKSRNDPDVTKYCCTTPPENSGTCNAGPLPHTKYVQAVHQFCPGVYAFAYDDGQGLLRCSYGQYRLTFMCPGIPLSEQKFEEIKDAVKDSELIFSVGGALTFVLFAAALGVGLALVAVQSSRFRRLATQNRLRSSFEDLPPEE